MPWIAQVISYNAAWEKIERFGFFPILDELGRILTNFNLPLLEMRNQNSGGVVRQIIDARFAGVDGWIGEERGGGDIDWIKRMIVNGTKLAIGVELQVSGRGGGSHLTDLTHLRAGIADPDDARIDIGIMVVPTDRMAVFLTDRVEGIGKVQDYLPMIRSDNLPILLIAIEHDGPGAAIPKRPKLGAGSPRTPKGTLGLSDPTLP